MAGEDPFELEGVVVETMSNGTCRVELANGHQLVGFFVGRLRGQAGTLKVGGTVTVKLSPFDLSEGRVIAIGKNLHKQI